MVVEETKIISDFHSLLESLINEEFFNEEEISDIFSNLCKIENIKNHAELIFDLFLKCDDFTQKFKKFWIFNCFHEKHDEKFFIEFINNLLLFKTNSFNDNQIALKYSLEKNDELFDSKQMEECVSVLCSDKILGKGMINGSRDLEMPSCCANDDPLAENSQKALLDEIIAPLCSTKHDILKIKPFNNSFSSICENSCSNHNKNSKIFVNENQNDKNNHKAIESQVVSKYIPRSFNKNQYDLKILFKSSIIEKFPIILKLAYEFSTNVESKSRRTQLAYLIYSFYSKCPFSNIYPSFLCINYFCCESSKEKRKVILKWAKKKLKEEDIKTTLINDFFDTEARYLKDIRLLTRIILLKKSHKLLFMKIHLFMREDLIKEIYKMNLNSSMEIFENKFPGKYNNEVQEIENKPSQLAVSSKAFNNKNEEKAKSLSLLKYILEYSQILLLKTKIVFKQLKNLINNQKNTNQPNVEFIFSESCLNTIESLLLQSYSREFKNYTDLLLLIINNENLIIKIIIEFQHSTPILFKYCHTIDEKYVQAIEICHEFSDLIQNKDLCSILKSKLLPDLTKKYKIFTKIIDLAIKKKYKINSEYFFEKNNPENSLIYTHRELTLESLRKNGLIELYKMNYFIENQIKIKPSRFIKYLQFLGSGINPIKNIQRLIEEREESSKIKIASNINDEELKIIMKIFFYLKNEKAIEILLNTLGPLFIKGLMEYEKYSKFYIKCINYLIDKKHDISSASIFKKNGVIEKQLIQRINGFRKVNLICIDDNLGVLKNVNFKNLCCDCSHPHKLDLNWGINHINSNIIDHPDETADSQGNQDAKYQRDETISCEFLKSMAQENSIKNVLIKGLVFLVDSSIVIKDIPNSFTFIAEYKIINNKENNRLLKIGNKIAISFKNNTFFIEDIKKKTTILVSQATKILKNIKNSPEISINLKIQYKNRKIKFYINGFENAFNLEKIKNLKIDGEFHGVLNSLIFYESNRLINYEFEQGIGFYRKTIRPLQKMLKTNNLAGLVINSEEAFILNKSVKHKTNNLIELI